MELVWCDVDVGRVYLASTCQPDGSSTGTMMIVMMWDVMECAVSVGCTS